MEANGPHIRLVLWKAHKAVETVDKASIAATGLCLTDFAVLEAILHKGPMPVNTIGKKVLLTSGSISTAVDRLAKRGLVQRLQDPSDGRVFMVHLTKSGKQVIEDAYRRHNQNLETTASVLSAEERSALVRLLKKLGRHAESQANSGGKSPAKEHTHE
ncbi:MAG: MarR family transcriptional regulator [Desulfobacterales bacterium]|nr:MarR family transcriptional regulator [Desulfobacterales bacterium]